MRVIREPDGQVALFFNPPEFGVVRVGLGYRENAAKLGRALIAVNERPDASMRRLTRGQECEPVQPSQDREGGG